MKSTLLVVVWIITLAAGIGIGYLWRDTAMPDPQPVATTSALPSSAPQATPQGDSNEALIERLERENEQMGQTIFQMTLKQIISGTDALPEDGYIEGCWQRYLDHAEHSQGWNNLDNMLNMMMELARFSTEGVRFLDEIAYDPRRPETERVAALQMLAHLPHPDAFDSLIAFRDESVMELDYPYDLVMRHVASLATAEIAPRIPELLDQIQYELGADNFSPERPTVLFYLADKHNIREAETLLYDKRLFQESILGVMHAAQTSHSQLGQDFLAYIAESHEDVRIRRAAEDMLESW